MSDSKIKPTQYTPGIIVKILLSLVVAIGVLYLLVAIFYPVEELLLSFGPPTPTPTITPTVFYETPTPRATYTPTITVTPTITNTPFPESKYFISDLANVRPEAPLGAQTVYIIDNLDAQANPSFDHYQWTLSDVIGADIGREFYEDYFATFNPGSISWSMDQTLPPALYEIFVLDTLYSSGGFLEFSVTMDGQELQPITGRKLLQYITTQSEPPQYQDEWRSIGIYDLQSLGLLSVSTEWGVRDELSIVAVDRIMIVRHSEFSRAMLSTIPDTVGTMFVIDDEDATFSTDQYWKYWEDEQAWGNRYQVMTEPPLETTVTWRLPALLPHGEYSAYAWIPQSNASIPVSYALYAGGLLLQQSDESLLTEFPQGQGQNQPGQWITLGNWVIPPHFGNYVRIEIVLTIPASDSGEVIIDAVVILQKPSEVTEE
jgi:hypothetical protein